MKFTGRTPYHKKREIPTKEEETNSFKDELKLLIGRVESWNDNLNDKDIKDLKYDFINIIQKSI